MIEFNLENAKPRSIKLMLVRAWSIQSSQSQVIATEIIVKLETICPCDREGNIYVVLISKY
jgi:hypothetical protein